MLFRSDTRNTDDYGTTSDPFGSGMSADVSSGVAAGTNFGGNTDADTDAGLSLKAATNDVKETVKDGVDSAKTALGDSAEGVKVKTGELVEQAKTQVSALTTQATDKVKEQLGTQKSKAAEGLNTFTDAIMQTASTLEEKGQAPIANAVSGLAEKVDDFAGYLQNKSVDELASDITNYAKKNPQVFVGGAFVLGLALARFLKSSGKSDIGHANSSTALVPYNKGTTDTSYTTGTGYVSGTDYAPTLGTGYSTGSTYNGSAYGANDPAI